MSSYDQEKVETEILKPMFALWPPFRKSTEEIAEFCAEYKEGLSYFSQATLKKVWKFVRNNFNKRPSVAELRHICNQVQSEQAVIAVKQGDSRYGSGKENDSISRCGKFCGINSWTVEERAGIYAWARKDSMACYDKQKEWLENYEAIYGSQESIDMNVWCAKIRQANGQQVSSNYKALKSPDNMRITYQ